MITRNEECLRDAVAGDEAALTTLLEHYGVQVLRKLRINSCWQGQLDADDVMQVTYLEAFLRIGQFKPNGPDAFAVWLQRIAENNLRDAIKGLERGKRPNPRDRVVSPSDDGSYVVLLEELAAISRTPSRSAAAREVRQIVDDVLRKLPPDYERVLRLCELEGRSGPEAAATMCRSHGAIKMLLARARERLRELLGAGARYFSDVE
jgi:RNA polymerase sigma-70 factor (ECF subfamily)